jgi:hypothetical protein
VGATARPTDLDDVSVVVFRKLLPLEPVVTNGEPIFFFLSMPGASDPPESVLAALPRLGGTLLPGSQGKKDAGLVTHVSKAGVGMILRIDGITWGASGNDAVVEASWYRETRVAQGYRIRLVRRDGGWVIVKEETAWVS